MGLWFIVLISSVLVAQQADFCGAANLATVQNIQQLKARLSQGYDKDVFPIGQTVSVNMFLITLDVDLAAKQLVTDVWFHYIWVDPRLTWNPAEFGGIQSFQVPSERVALPDVAVYNSIRPNLEKVDCGPSNVVIYANGTMNLVPFQCHLKPFCNLNLDEDLLAPQTCNFTVAPWNYNSPDEVLAFGEPIFDISSRFYDISDWKVLNSGGTTSVRQNCCTPGSYNILTFFVTFQWKGRSSDIPLPVPEAPVPPVPTP